MIAPTYLMVAQPLRAEAAADAWAAAVAAGPTAAMVEVVWGDPGLGLPAAAAELAAGLLSRLALRVLPPEGGSYASS